MLNIETVKVSENSLIVNGVTFVPMVLANKEYQQVLDWINEGNLPEGEDVIEPDYKQLRTGKDGYAPIADQLDMQFKNDGSWEAHINEVKQRFPKTITGGVTQKELPVALLEDAQTRLFTKQLDDYRKALARLAIDVTIEPTVETIELTDPANPFSAVTVTVENPALILDQEERAAAQAIVDATPQEVKDAAEAE